MRITIEIPDEEIRAKVVEIVADKIAYNVYHGYSEGHFYRKDIKEAVREIIKDDIDNLSERAVLAAAKSIENRGIKNLLQVLEEK